MKKILQFITWPSIAGLLAAIILLQWYAPLQQRAGTTEHGPTRITSFSDAVQRAVPSVVNIYTSKRIQARQSVPMTDPITRRLLERDGSRQDRIQRSLGSGVIVSDEGLVLTSRHIIDGADAILVRLHDGRTGLAQVIGSDPHTDLAVLRIAIEGLQPVTLGNPDEARVGDVVLAIGNPYGFGHSVSQGIISALGRYGLRLSTYEDFIQTDAAINQGNSGGALIDTQGRLLGINAATFSRSGEWSGIGLATPADLAMGVTQDIVRYGKVIRGWMGLGVETVYTTGSTQPSLLVTNIHPLGPAARAGIRPGDVVTHIDMQPVVDGRVTSYQIALLRPGDAVDVTLLREGEQLKFKVIVGTQPDAG
jgi:serine protease DegS